MQLLAKRPISLKRPPPKPPTYAEIREGLAACARLHVDQPEHEKLWKKIEESLLKAKAEFYPEHSLFEDFCAEQEKKIIPEPLCTT